LVADPFAIEQTVTAARPDSPVHDKVRLAVHEQRNDDLRCPFLGQRIDDRCASTQWRRTR